MPIPLYAMLSFSIVSHRASLNRLPRPLSAWVWVVLYLFFLLIFLRRSSVQTWSRVYVCKINDLCWCVRRQYIKLTVTYRLCFHVADWELQDCMAGLTDCLVLWVLTCVSTHLFTNWAHKFPFISLPIFLHLMIFTLFYFFLFLAIRFLLLFSVVPTHLLVYT